MDYSHFLIHRGEIEFSCLINVPMQEILRPPCAWLCGYEWLCSRRLLWICLQHTLHQTERERKWWADDWTRWMRSMTPTLLGTGLSQKKPQIALAESGSLPTPQSYSTSEPKWTELQSGAEWDCRAGLLQPHRLGAVSASFHRSTVIYSFWEMQVL